MLSGPSRVSYIYEAYARSWWQKRREKTRDAKQLERIYTRICVCVCVRSLKESEGVWRKSVIESSNNGAVLFGSWLAYRRSWRKERKKMFRLIPSTSGFTQRAPHSSNDVDATLFFLRCQKWMCTSRAAAPSKIKTKQKNENVLYSFADKISGTGEYKRK